MGKLMRRRWEVIAADLPCTVELEQSGDWVVTVAAVTVGRDPLLVTALLRAGGGLIDVEEATRVARRVTESLDRQSSEANAKGL